MSYSYYPGCSANGTGRPYEESLLAVFETLGTGLDALDDWNCCGATAYPSTDWRRASRSPRATSRSPRTPGRVRRPSTSSPRAPAATGRC